MRSRFGLEYWQAGCLIGLAVGLVQGLTGNLGLEAMTAEQGLVRLGSTMAGAAAICGVLGHVLTFVQRQAQDNSDQV